MTPGTQPPSRSLWRGSGRARRARSAAPYSFRTQHSRASGTPAGRRRFSNQSLISRMAAACAGDGVTSVMPPRPSRGPARHRRRATRRRFGRRGRARRSAPAQCAAAAPGRRSSAPPRGRDRSWSGRDWDRSVNQH